MAQAKVLQGFIELIEKRYNLQVMASAYNKVNEMQNIYYMMLEVKLSDDMFQSFKRKYSSTDNNGFVEWSIQQDTIRFFAERGDEILELLDTIVFENEEPKYIRYRTDNAGDVILHS